MRILITLAVAAACVFGGWTQIVFGQIGAPPPVGNPADPPPPNDPPPPTLLPDANDGPSIFSPDAAGGSGQDGVNAEPLARGPLHEAFAEQVNLDPQPSPVVPKQPPEPINELPPEIKPEGDNVEWISGYWAWDDEREDFIWVSGVWRRIPPGRSWLPGYWTAADGGHRWIAGTWASADAGELSILPQPPASLEHGANRPAESANQIWIPGSWTYQDDQYYWRAGAWSAGYDDWTWIPERYIWTPNGCAYVDGYWDYPVTRRGYCYAPYFFTRPIYRRPGYALTPYVALNIGRVFAHIFVRPYRHHYYFGDYYGAAYVNRGYHPWHHYHRKHYEPLLAHYRAHHYRRGVDYVGHLSRWHDYHVRRPDVRPSRSFAHLNHVNHAADRLRIPGSRTQGLANAQALRGRAPQSGRSHNQLGHHVRDLTARSLDASRVVRLPEQRRQEVAQLSRKNQQSVIENRRATSVRSGPKRTALSGLPHSAAAGRLSSGLTERPRNVDSRSAPARAGGRQLAAPAESPRGAPVRSFSPGAGGRALGSVGRPQSQTQSRPQTRDGRNGFATTPSTIADRLRSRAPSGAASRAVNPRDTRTRSAAPSAVIGTVPGLSARSTAPRPADRAARPANSIQERIRQAQQSAAAARSQATGQTRQGARGTTSFNRAPSSAISRQPAPRAAPQSSISNQFQQRIREAQQRSFAARSGAVERARTSRAPAPVVRTAPQATRTPAPRVQTTVRPASPPPRTSTSRSLIPRASAPRTSMPRAQVQRRVAPSPAPRASVARPSPAPRATVSRPTPTRVARPSPAPRASVARPPTVRRAAPSGGSSRGRGGGGGRRGR